MTDHVNALGASAAALDRPVDEAQPVGLRLLPSFSDFFFISLIYWLWLSSKDGWSNLLMDGDIGWHIRAGQWMLAHGTVPHQDLFSFTRPGAEWFAWEWLSDVLYAGLFQWAGLKGVVLASGLVIALFATLLLRYVVWKGANAFVAMGVTLVSIGAASVHFHARPHIFTLLFLTASVFLVDADLRHASRRVWWLVPLTIAWTNLHGGFPILIALLGLTAVGAGLETLLGWRQEVVPYTVTKRYLMLAAACSLASLVNPYFYHVHVHIVEYLRSDFIKDNVMEFMAPNFRSEPLLQYQVILFAGLLCAGGLLWRRQLTTALVLLFFAHQSLQSVRHVTLFVILAAPVIGRELTQVWRAIAGRVDRKAAVRLLYQMAQDATPRLQYVTIWPVVFTLALILLPGPIQWPTNFPKELFPVQINQQHADILTQSRLLTPDQWGDYLIYANYPRQRVFYDGRSDFYGESLGKEYLAALQGRYDWEKVLDKYGITAVLCPPSWPLSSLLKERRAWVLVADQKTSLLFVRKGRIEPNH